jgi:hypothetical protein
LKLREKKTVLGSGLGQQSELGKAMGLALVLTLVLV